MKWTNISLISTFVHKTSKKKMKINLISTLTLLLLNVIICIKSEIIHLHCEKDPCDWHYYQDDGDDFRCSNNCVFNGLTIKREDKLSYTNVGNSGVDTSAEINQNVEKRWNSFLQIKIFNSSMTLFPAKMFRYFPKVNKFKANKVGLTEIEKNDFNDAYKMEILELKQNNITILPALVFVEALKLRHLDLSHNQISKIEQNAFFQCDLIQHIRLSHNQLDSLANHIFSDLKELTNIFLDHNKLKKIDSVAFAGCNNLIAIDISFNEISTMNCSSVIRLQSSLNLNNNPFGSIDSKCFENYPVIWDEVISTYEPRAFYHVSRLYVSNTKIMEINFPKKFEFPAVELEACHLVAVDLENFLNRFRRLERLDLSDTIIGPLNITTFARLDELKILRLRNCSLSHLTFGTFSFQTSLTTLDISYNYLKDIDYHIFLPALRFIQELDLSGNNLTNIDGLSLTHFTNLKRLGIVHNNFQCLYMVHKVMEFDDKKIVMIPDYVREATNETHVGRVHCSHENNSTVEELNSYEQWDKNQKEKQNLKGNCSEKSVSYVNNVFQNPQNISQRLFEMSLVALCSALIAYNVAIYKLNRTKKCYDKSTKSSISEHILMNDVEN